MSGIQWQKSSFSTDGNECIELAQFTGNAFLRESDTPDVVIVMHGRQLRALTRSVKANLLDHRIQ